MRRCSYSTYLDNGQEHPHGLWQYILPLLANRMQYSLCSRDGTNKVLENVEFHPNIFIRIAVPQLCIFLSVGHQWEDDILDDLQDVRLDQLPRQGMADASVDIVETKLHHPWTDIDTSAEGIKNLGKKILV